MKVRYAIAFTAFALLALFVTLPLALLYGLWSAVNDVSITAGNWLIDFGNLPIFKMKDRQ